MSLKKQIGYNTGVQIIGKVVSTLLGVAGILLMMRTLGVEKFGWYITASSFLQLFGIISDMGFATVTANMLSEPRFDKKELLNTIFTWRVITALICNGIAPLLIWFFPYPDTIKWAATIGSLSYFAFYISQIFTAYFQVKLTMQIVALGEILWRVIMVVGLALVYKFSRGLLTVMSVLALGSIFNAFFLWSKSEGVKLQLKKDISLAFAKKIWPVALGLVFNSIYLQGDRVILPLFLPQTTIGLYGAAMRVIETITPMTAVVMGIMLPLISYSWSRQEKDDFQKRSQIGFNLVLLLFLPIMAGLMALSTPVMVFAGGEAFAPSGPILLVLALKVFGLSLGGIFGYSLIAVGQQKKAALVFGTDALLSLVGFLIFIPRFGLWGAAWVSVFSELYAGLFLGLTFIKTTGFKPPVWSFIKIIAASALMGLGIYWLQPFNLFICLALGATVYGLLILAFRVISIQTIKEMLPSRTRLP